MKASLNHVFRTIWSDALNTWVAVSEITSAKGKRSKSCVLSAAELAENNSEAGNVAKPNRKLRFKPIAIVLACCFSLNAQANPIGAQVTNGAASFNQIGNFLTITNSPNAIINWQSFSIAQGETTRFIQQSASSSVLNRVLGADPSSLLGTLTSNGRVFLINPAGILVGAGANINVPGFVASTLNLSDSNFLAGKLNFDATPNAGTIQNKGTITTPEGGTVYLIAPQVENYGVINTPKGETILAAGNTVQLMDSGTPGVTVQITGSNTTATNLGQILSDSGRIGMVGAVVNNSGTISANSLVSQGGRVFLQATSLVEAGGTITANGTSGGTIEVFGNEAGVMDGATVSANGTQGGGTVLVGGDYQGKNPNIQNAQVTYFAPTATISADATSTGNGGKVIVWADNTTRAYGNISARGGANGGNGGFVEVSGHKYLDFQGLVDTRAPHGEVGTLLLDPTSIYIANNQANATTAGMTGTDTSVDGASYFIPASTAIADSLLSVGTLNYALNFSSVNVTTANANGTGNGDIIVVDPVTWSTTNILTLTAARNISISQNITGTGGTLALNAGGSITNNSGAGLISVNTLQTSSVGGTTLAGANTVSLFNATNTGGGNISLTNTAPLTIVGTGTGISQTGGGAVNITNTGSITTSVNGLISADGNINLFATGTPTADVTINGGINYTNTTSSGTLTIKANHNVVVQAAPIQSTGTQALNVILDSAYTGTGAVGIFSGGNILSNGGNITVGGGSGTISAGTGFAQGYYGVFYDGSASGNGVDVRANLNAAGGNIVINGIADTSGSAFNPIGVSIGGIVITTGSGTIILTGQSMSPTNSPYGVEIGNAGTGETTVNGAVTSANGNILINGTSGLTNSHGNIGLLVINGSTVATGSGNITLNGTAASTAPTTGGGGVDIQAYNGAPSVLAGTGNILISSQNGTGTSLLGATISAGGNVTLDAVGGSILVDHYFSSYTSTNYSSSIFAGNNVMSTVTGDIRLNNGSSLVAANDVSLTFASPTSMLYLNDSVGMTPPSTILANASLTTTLNFLARSSGGVVIDGVDTLSTTFGGSGIFTVSLYTPAIEGVGLGLAVNYSSQSLVNPVSQSLATLVNPILPPIPTLTTIVPPPPDTYSTGDDGSSEDGIGGTPGNFGGDDDNNKGKPNAKPTKC